MSDKILASDKKKFSLIDLLDKIDEKIKRIVFGPLKETVENFVNDLRKKKEQSEIEENKE